MRDSESLFAIVGTALLLLFGWAILRAIVRAFLSLWAKPIPLPAQSEIDAARRLLETPRPVVGGSEWMRYECRPVMCEAPAQASELVVHDRTNPEHRAQCRECREGVKLNHSGVSYRSN